MTSSAKDKGRLILWRKIEESWQWQKPLHRAAWMWILIKAAYKAHNSLQPGQCYFTLSQSKTAWGMTINQARGFLRRCVKEGDIIWEPGRPGVAGCVNHTSDNTSPATSKDTSNNTCRGKITLLNYSKYRTTKLDNDTSDNTTENTSLEPSKHAIEKESIKKQSKEVLPASREAGKAHQSLIKFFTENYEDLLGVKYVFQGGKDATAAKRILKSGLPLDEIQNRIIRYLEDEDPFVEKQGFTLSFFSTRINSYAKTSKEKGGDQTINHPSWAEIKKLPAEEFLRFSMEARPYAANKCGKREPSDELIREYMIKLYEAEKARAP